MNYTLRKEIKVGNLYLAINLIILLAGSCRLKIGEILGLKLSDIDEINLTISIKRKLKRVGDKNKQ
ncbi:hypothetical protein [Clostridium botulinum]|uniref:hypothetical protein n=1 Tax=Clostridium botulinum TaxID=1491 RepID=UPI003DA30FC8